MKYVVFEDMHDDDCGKIVEVTEDEFNRLEPHRADMENCNPLPEPLHSLLWDDIYMREDQGLEPNAILLTSLLVQRIC